MARDVFAWAESPGSALQEEPRVKSVGFGDGYVQESPDGLNPSMQVWNLVFSNVSDAGGNAILGFVRSHIGVRFDWTPVWATTPIVVACTKWSRSLGDQLDTSTINLTFEQRFEP